MIHAHITLPHATEGLQPYKAFIWSISFKTSTIFPLRFLPPAKNVLFFFLQLLGSALNPTDAGVSSSREKQAAQSKNNNKTTTKQA